MTRISIQILGVGCAKCETLAQNAETAARELKLDAQLEKISDMTRILEFDILQLPGLVVNGQILTEGTVPSVGGIKTLLQTFDNRNEMGETATPSPAN